MKKVACPECDLLYDKVDLALNESATCGRCNTILYYDTRDLTKPVALLFATFFLYFPAIFLPFLGMTIKGQVKDISIWQGAVAIASDDTYLLAIIIFCLIIIVPFIRLLGLNIIILLAHLNRTQLFDKSLINFIIKLSPWGMTEVYLAAVVVTLIKITHYASVSFLHGFWAFVVFIVFQAATNAALPKKKIWEIVNDRSS